jgi:hypothetical protein
MRRRQNTTAPSPRLTAYFTPFLLRAAHLAPGLRVLDIATGTGRCEAQRPCRRRLSWLRQGAWFLPPRSAALHRPISRQEDLIYSPFSDCSSARRGPIFGLWLTWHHPAVRAMPCRAFRRLPHSAETQAAEMWPLFCPISVVSVFWLLDLTVVVPLPSSDPFARYRFKIPAACREICSSLIQPPIHISLHFRRAAEV